MLDTLLGLDPSEHLCLGPHAAPSGRKLQGTSAELSFPQLNTLNNNFQGLVATCEAAKTEPVFSPLFQVKQLKRLQQLQPIFSLKFGSDVTFQSSSDEYIFKAAPSHTCGSAGSSASEKKSNINSSISSSAAIAAASLCLPCGLGRFCTNN